MTDNLWNLNETSASTQRVLSEGEREFLMTGNTGSYTGAEMERRATAKAAQLPERIQQLLDDVSLLYYRGYLSSNQGHQIWSDLLEISRRSQLVRDTSITRTHGKWNREIELGMEFASILRMIHNEPVSPDIVWGVIMGLVGDATGDHSVEAENLVDLFGELNERYDVRLFGTGAADHYDDDLSETEDLIREILIDRGFAPASPLVHAIKLETVGVADSDSIYDHEKEWEADPERTEPPARPDELPSLQELQQNEIKSIVLRLEGQTQLHSIDRLAKDLREDAVRIQNRKWRGVDPDQAIRFVKDTEPTQIQEFDQTEPQGQNNMTTALRRLKNDDSEWVNQPVLQENEGENMYWTLTPYGDLLYEVRVNHNCSTDWLYNYVVDTDELDEQTYRFIESVI